MGNYSKVSLNITITKVAEFQKLLDEIRSKVIAGNAHEWERELNLFHIDENNNLKYEGEDREWYDFQEWIIVLAYYAADGQIEFVGEDKEKWGYFIRDHEVYIMEYTVTLGERITNLMME